MIVDVREFVVGDGKHDDTDAMQALLLLEPHSIVVVPANVTVKTGPLRLSSDLVLQVDGTLQAIEATGEVLVHTWPIMSPLIIYNTSEDGGHEQQYQAFLYANNVSNLRITGTGVIHGRGEAWWNAFTNKSKDLQAGRPNLIQIVNSRNIEIDSVTLMDSPFWTIHPVLSEHVHIHHTTIRSRLYAPNVDGIDPDSCRHVMIEYNDVSCGDDHIAIKAGRCGDSMTPNKCTDPTWKAGQYQTTNVTVRYNTFRTGMGIAVGSESSGGIRNIDIHDNIIGLCQFGNDGDGSCGWGPALHVKTTVSRGGAIEDVVFHDNIVYNTSAFILLEMDYQTGNNKPPQGYAATSIRNISFLRNRAMGRAKRATFDCSVHDSCHEIIAINNTVENAETSPWDCHFVQSYRVSGNMPEGLEECMANSMNQTDLWPTTAS